MYWSLWSQINYFLFNTSPVIFRVLIVQFPHIAVSVVIIGDRHTLSCVHIHTLLVKLM